MGNDSVTPTPDAGAVTDAATATPPAPDGGGLSWEVLSSFIDAGGPVVLILAGLSVIALMIVAAKVFHLASCGVWKRGDARRAVTLFRQGRHGDAMHLLETSRFAGAGLIAEAMRLRGQRHVSESHVREDIAARASDLIAALGSWLRPLELIAGIAPLMGLFGTVLGMITSFRQLSAAGSAADPSVLSGGIWEALLTTAVGLAVAIPVVALHAWLDRTVERTAHDLETLLGQSLATAHTELPDAAAPRNAVARAVPAGE